MLTKDAPLTTDSSAMHSGPTVRRPRPHRVSLSPFRPDRFVLGKRLGSLALRAFRQGLLGAAPPSATGRTFEGLVSAGGMRGQVSRCRTLELFPFSAQPLLCFPTAVLRPEGDDLRRSAPGWRRPLFRPEDGDTGSGLLATCSTFELRTANLFLTAASCRGACRRHRIPRSMLYARRHGEILLRCDAVAGRAEFTSCGRREASDSLP